MSQNEFFHLPEVSGVIRSSLFCITKKADLQKDFI
jgi:hypothetical protein